MSFSALHCGQFLKRKRKSHCSRWPSSSSNHHGSGGRCSIKVPSAVVCPRSCIAKPQAGQWADAPAQSLLSLRRPYPGHTGHADCRRSRGSDSRFPRRRAQTAANDLLVKTHRLKGGGWRSGRRAALEAGGQHRDVHQIAIRLRFKGLDDAIPLRPVRVSPVISAARLPAAGRSLPRRVPRWRQRSSPLCGFRRTPRSG